MNCNCIEEIEAKIKELHQPQVKAPIESVRCRNITYVLSGVGAGTYISIPFGIKANTPGYRSEKGKDFGVVVSYRPFCGTKAKADKQAKA
ncbi:hypothetical protein ACI0FW_00363 [Alcaligenes nematophilus]